MPVLLGLDLGTTSVSAVAIADDGRVLASVSRTHGADASGLPRGRAEQDPVRLREAALESLGELAATLPERPAALGVTGQMHGVLLLDERRQPLSNLVTWQDRRANEPFGDSSRTILEEFLDRCSDDELASTGTHPAPGFLGVTLFALRSQDDLPKQVRHAAFPADWIVAEATAGTPLSAPSNAASSGVYDVRHGRWSPDLLQAAEIPVDWLPEVRPEGETVGRLSADWASATGLPQGLPVANAVGDNQAAVIGSVPADEPAIQINVGTGGQINWPVEEFVRVEGMDTRPLPPERLMLVGAGLAGGDAWAWVQRTARQWARELGFEVSADAVYERLGELVAETADGGPTCVPTFRGTRRNPRATGTFSGVTNDNFGLGAVARAVLEGIVTGFHDFYLQAGDAAPADAQRIVGTGNALRRTPVLVEAVERRFGRPVLLPEHEEAAAYGAALLAGVSAGVWHDLASAGRAIHLDQR